MFGSTCLALVALSCGSTNRSPNENIAPAASVGDEPPPSPAAPADMPAKAEHGRLVVQAKVGGNVVPAHARLLLGGDYAVDFAMGEEISANAGENHIEVTLNDNSVLVDQPTQQLDVFIEPVKVAKAEAVFPWAKVQLNVMSNGSLQPPTKVKLIRDGNVVAEVKSGAAFLISPGKYEADVLLRGKSVRVKGLVFFQSSEQVVPVHVHP